MRLIDADALLRKICGMSCGCEPDQCGFIDEYKHERCKAGQYVADAPTVDAEPVKTAQLIRETDRERHWHCSRCGKVFGLVGLMHKYCPECGARIER